MLTFKKSTFKVVFVVVVVKKTILKTGGYHLNKRKELCFLGMMIFIGSMNIAVIKYEDICITYEGYIGL